MLTRNTTLKMSWSSVQYEFQKTLTPFALIINLILIQLIWHKSPKAIGFYKYLMMYISIFEIIYSVLDILAAPDFFSHDSIFIVITSSERMLVPQFFQVPFTNIFCSMFGVSLVIFVIHFIYRYLAITK